MLKYFLTANKHVRLFMAADLLYALAIGAYQALFVLHLMAQGADVGLLGLFGGLTGIVGLAVSPLIGLVADRGYRRTVWLSGVVTAIGGIALISLGRSVWLWWAAEIMITYGITALLVIESAILAPLAGEDQRSVCFSLTSLNYNIFTSLGSALAGFLVGLLGGGTTPYQIPLLLFAVIGALGLPLFAMIPVRENKVQQRQATVWRQLKPSRVSLIAGTLGAFNGAGHNLITPFIAYILASRFGWDAKGIGLFFSVIGLAGVLGPVVAGWLPSRRVHLSMVILYGLFALAFGLMMLPSSYAFISGVFLARISRYGLIPLLAAAVNNAAKGEETGSALAWRIVGFNGGSSLGSTTGGHLLSLSSAYPSLLYQTGILVNFAAILFVLRVKGWTKSPEPRASV